MGNAKRRESHTTRRVPRKKKITKKKVKVQRVPSDNSSDEEWMPGMSPEQPRHSKRGQCRIGNELNLSLVPRGSLISI